ncbi:MAG: PucR family transcriptional regulator ligand-binding domain-containing protein [Deltaproteobacteria bacterium]|nr:PucR family transcriptional regulator ligand-binding domain-containing protein [Deltaproteobacteria bacterium]MBW2050623.1 PucR family transcriptional regulator ligand-binding domain-containing protein [Deltaproteobacteria bacterium]MBW2139483.1 PucR family transcriptional regulator ligand-binding domain-containing protein [Deltaproteobacteria bacterium]MBW2322568.1 PucR family transcriptional regulator ligand-binding domain-containing protein [Deltaproteobacteria bacterium]
MIKSNSESGTSLRHVVKILNAEVLTGEEPLDQTVQHVECTDLMSQVLAFIKSGNLLLTGLTNIQVVNTADISGLIGVVFVRGRSPSKEVIAKAKEVGLPLFLTSYSMYEAAGHLYLNGLPGSTE